MAVIPRLMVIKAVICETYICYEAGTESGHVYCSGKSVFNPFTKIELEQAESNSKYYHLRFCHSNRYWAKSSDDKWIAAVSKQPEEDTSNSSCTFFVPTVDDKGGLHLTHVQSGKSVQADSASTRLYLQDEDMDASNSYAFTFVDWDTLVKLPNRVVFKGFNGIILKSATHADLPYLHFTSTDGNDGYSAQEVSLHPDGHLRMKSEFCGKFWKHSSGDWILSDSSDEDGHDGNTLFWPVKVDDKTIALRAPRYQRFCGILTAEGKLNYLIAPGHHPNMQVQVLVLESYVHNVKFRMEDARVFDEQRYLAGSGTGINESDKEATLTFEVVYVVPRTFSFTHSYSLTIDAKTTFNAGTPTILAGQIESVDFIGVLEWGQIVTEEKTAEVSYTVKVPAKSRVRVNYVGTRGNCSVPFSYTQGDTRSDDGEHVNTYHNDGIFYGANCHSFHFEQSIIEPL